MENKRDKIKRARLYQSGDNGSMRMTEIETMIKALRLVWILSRLLIPEIKKMENDSRLLPK